MSGQVLPRWGRATAFRRLWSDRSGAAALEFALIAPALFLLVMGGMEAGRWLWTKSALEMSVAQAAQCAAWNVSGCTTQSGVLSYATKVTPQLNFPTSTFTYSATATCGGVTASKVTASYPYHFIAKGLFPLTPTLTASACFATVPSSAT